MYASSYWYQYGVGGLIFLLGLWLCWRNGDLDLTRAQDRRFLYYCLFGMLAYALGQGFFQFYCAAP